MAGVAYQSSHPQGWNGMTIKVEIELKYYSELTQNNSQELLDKVDIDGPKPQEISNRAKHEPAHSPQLQSAYLGKHK